MSSIFISHSSQDNAVAEKLKLKLEAWGHHSIFLDFDPEQGIPAGTNWEQILYARLRACQAIVVLCSPASMASKWVFAEITHGRSVGKQIFPIIVADCGPVSILSDTQFFNLANDPDYLGLRRGLREAGLEDTLIWDGQRDPYPGLTAFQEADAALFFGRTDDIRKGLEQLRGVRRSGSERLVLYLGASGSGKSSLVRAGLIPRLKKDADSWIVFSPFRPNEGLGDPFDNLATGFCEAFEQYGNIHRLTDIRQQLTASQHPHSLLQLARDLAVASQRREATVLVIIDQFEELLGSALSDRGQTFLQWLGEALRVAQSLPACPLLVLATMRSDFVANFQQLAELQAVETAQFLVNPIPVSNFGELIEGPAQLVGLALEPGLVTKIVEDASTENALPLLAFTLAELWWRYGDDGRLTLAEYEILGGLKGSIKQRAKEVFNQTHLDSELETELRNAFLNMVQIGEEKIDELSPYIRKPVKRIELPSEVIPVLEKFVDARLLVEKESGTYEVAHEALFQAWPQLNTWLENNYEFLRWRQRLNEFLKGWEDSRRDQGALLRGGPLATAEDWLKSYIPNLTLDEQSYIQKSIELRNQQQQEQEEQQQKELKRAQEELKRARRTTAVAITTGLIFMGLTGLVVAQWFTTNQQKLKALTESADAKLTLNQNSIDSLQTSVEAGAQLGGIWGNLATSQDRAEVLEALSLAVNSVMERNRWRGHDDIIQSVHFSPDGQFLVTTSYDNTIKLWSPDGCELQSLEEHNAPVMDATFNDDGTILVTASLDGGLNLWQRVAVPEKSTNEHQKIFKISSALRSNEDLSSIDLSHDGQMILTGSLGGNVTLWQRHANDWKATTIFKAKAPIEIKDVSFSPDDSMVATGDTGGTIQLFDLEGNLKNSYKDKDEILGIDFSLDGTTIAAASYYEAILWHWPSKEIEPIQLKWNIGQIGHTEAIEDIKFSPDGQTIATASLDGTVKLWDLEGKLLQTLNSSGSFINSISYSPADNLIAMASREGIISTWQLEPAMTSVSVVTNNISSGEAVSFSPQASVIAFNDDNKLQLQNLERETPSITPLYEHPVAISGIRFSPTGELVASSSYDGTVVVSRLNGTQKTSLLKHNDDIYIYQANFSPDEELLATAGEDGKVRLWNLQQGKQSRDWQAHDGEIFDVTFSPDGETILTASSDGTAKLWDLKGTEKVSLSGHSGPVYEATFNPIGTVIATAGQDNTVRLWKYDGSLIKILKGHLGPVYSVRFSPDGQIVASASQDRTIKLWRLDGTPINTLIGHQGTVNEISFSADSSQLASISNDGQVILWNINKLTSLESLITEGCEWLQFYFKSNMFASADFCSID